MGFLEKIFGSYSEKELKRIQPLVDKVLALEEQFRGMSDGELRDMTSRLKKRLQEGRAWTISCRRPLPPAGRLPTGSYRCVISRCRSWAASSCTRGASPR